jgi:predicted TIM-barrel fold metal-dependent hydrolase
LTSESKTGSNISLEREKVKNSPIFDTHTHFFPPNLLKALWQYFDQHYWPIYQKGTNDELVEFLYDKCGVTNHLVLNYAHKRGIATWLNSWTQEFCTDQKRIGKAIPFGTIHPEDEKKSDHMDLIFDSYEFQGLKLQLMVTDFHIWDERMDPVYKKIIDYDKVLLPHIGTGPTYSNFNPGKVIQCPFVGIKHLRRFLKKYPNMKIIVPHLGAEEYEAMWSLIDEYPNLYFDTAMIGVMFNPAFKDGLNLIPNEKLYALSNRLLFGSDFPNIPYSYNNSVQGWLHRGMKKDFYDEIFHLNAKELFNI